MNLQGASGDEGSSHEVGGLALREDFLQLNPRTRALEPLVIGE